MASHSQHFFFNTPKFRPSADTINIYVHDGAQALVGTIPFTEEAFAASQRDVKKYLHYIITVTVECTEYLRFWGNRTWVKEDETECSHYSDVFDGQTLFRIKHRDVVDPRGPRRSEWKTELNQRVDRYQAMMRLGKWIDDKRDYDFSVENRPFPQIIDRPLTYKERQHESWLQIQNMVHSSENRHYAHI